MPGLYLVGTPIGNLGDFSPRALETLREVDFIAAEDTRVSLKLLNHFGIHKPLVSYHEHNQRDSGQRILARILGGESCAVVTDAGMPCISDPGEDLVRLCAEYGIEIVIIPGPSAAVSALAVSGLATGRFCFEGFLTVHKGSRQEHLNEIKNETRTLIFYEAPHKLRATLRDLHKTLGDRRITLARELTKLHEEVVRTTLSDAVTRCDETPPRGEYVLVVEGAAAAAETEDPVSFDEAVSLLLERQRQGEPLSAAAKEIARLTGYRKADLYRAATQISAGE